ncbi:MAG: hypothetical protein ACOC6L_01965 [Thermodesulfobacteriota bacterium]
MPIRYLAEELYRLTKKVEELEKRLAALGSGPSPERGPLEIEILQTKKERDHVRAVLESKKEKPLV